jgi:hypothetical protein
VVTPSTVVVVSFFLVVVTPATVVVVSLSFFLVVVVSLSFAVVVTPATVVVVSYDALVLGVSPPLADSADTESASPNATRRRTIVPSLLSVRALCFTLSYLLVASQGRGLVNPARTFAATRRFCAGWQEEKLRDLAPSKLSNFPSVLPFPVGWV